jgi:3-oxoacyl-[acyl-carrier protein] reductase
MNQKARDALVAAVPVGRVGLPDDVGWPCASTSSATSFDGRTVDVDGGLSM